MHRAIVIDLSKSMKGALVQELREVADTIEKLEESGHSYMRTETNIFHGHLNATVHMMPPIGGTQPTRPP